MVRRRGLELAGPRWEIYGDWREDPADLETEVYYLLQVTVLALGNASAGHGGHPCD